MYTSSMTVEDMVREFSNELPQMIDVCDSKQPHVDRIILKSKTMPVYVHTSYTSKKGNVCLILWEAKNKKYVGDNSLVTLVSVMHMPTGRYAIMWSTVNGVPLYTIFTPHFFSRFAQRAGIQLSGVDLIRRYFKLNHSFGYNESREVFDGKEKTNIYGSTEEGIAMGAKLYTESNVFLFKTFITYDMCKGEQIEDFARADDIRRELHDDATKILLS